MLHWRGGRGIGSGWGKERSKSIALPPDAWSGGRVAAAALARAGAALFAGAEDALPCSRLALSTTEFGEIPVHKAMSITRFFGHSPARRGGTGSPAVCSPAGQATHLCHH